MEQAIDLISGIADGVAIGVFMQPFPGGSRYYHSRYYCTAVARLCPSGNGQ